LKKKLLFVVLEVEPLGAYHGDDFDSQLCLQLPETAWVLQISADQKLEKRFYG
jgi:hypothetical protein